MSKLHIKYDEDKLSITFSQENVGSITFNEGYLSYLLNSLKQKQDYPYRGGQFGVARVNGGVIMYDLPQGKKRVCIKLSSNQADKLIGLLSQKFDFILNSYSQETYDYDRLF